MKKLLIGFLLAIGITAIAGSFTDVVPGQSITSSIFNSVQNTVDGILDIEVPTGVNTHSARIYNNGSPSITSFDVDWIESVVLSGPGKIRVTFKSGFFAVIPAISLTAESDGVIGALEQVTNTSIMVSTYNHAATASNVNFTIYAKNQGSDFYPYKSIRQILIEAGLTFL